MTRSNPKRNVPREPQLVDHEAGDMLGDRSRTDFAGSSTRRLVRRTRKRAGERIETTAGGTMPTSGLSPKPPPVLVLYPDLVEPDEMPSAVYGQYPRGLIAKMLPWLRCARHEILHVCSGSLPPGEGIRVDIREAAKPDILADGRNLPLESGTVAAVMIDPPYSADYARSLYGVDYPRPSHLLREAARVVRPGGRIALVHYITAKPVEGLRFVKAFGLSTGFDMPMRAVSVYEREQPGMDTGAAPLPPSIAHVANDAGGCVSWCPACILLSPIATDRHYGEQAAERIDPLTLTCPVCKADPGQPCIVIVNGFAGRGAARAINRVRRPHPERARGGQAPA